MTQTLPSLAWSEGVVKNLPITRTINPGIPDDQIPVSSDLVSSVDPYCSICKSKELCYC